MNKKLDVALPEQMVAVIEEEVAAGHYASGSELVAEAMEVWLRSRSARDRNIAHMRARIQEAIDDPRPPVPLDEAFERLTANVKSRFKNR